MAKTSPQIQENMFDNTSEGFVLSRDTDAAAANNNNNNDDDDDDDNNNNNNNNNKWNVKTKVTPVIMGATGTISKSFRKYLSSIPGKHNIKEL
jgi:hypothetical protein